MTHGKPPTLSIIVPCYNEEEILEISHKDLHSKLQELINTNTVSENSFIVYVNDGSSDKTLQIIEKLAQGTKNVHGVDLCRNFGHQSALMAGMSYSKDRCDCAISIDADLQDDIDVFSEFIHEFNQGKDIVYGVRDNRDSDTFFKKNSAQFFYKVMQSFGVHLIYNHADFRLVSKYSMEQVLKFNEQDIFLRGIFPLLKLPSSRVYYARKARLAGETKYPLKKMISFALNGFTSFSIFPLRLITMMGLGVSFFCLCYSLYAIYRWSIGESFRGWTSTVIAIYFLGGVQLISLGIVGEYIGKIFSQVKRRPQYDIKRIYNDD